MGEKININKIFSFLTIYLCIIYQSVISVAQKYLAKNELIFVRVNFVTVDGVKAISGSVVKLWVQLKKHLLIGSQGKVLVTISIKLEIKKWHGVVLVVDIAWAH